MPLSRLNKEIVPNQVFIGCPWRTVRRKYFAITDDLKKIFPINFIIIGSEVTHTADDLLLFIKTKLETSSSAIFDVSGGNPNVSLEFGFAEGRNIESALYISTHGKNSKSQPSTIISDLAGKRRKEYKNELSLKRLIIEFSKNHPFSIKFEKALKKCTVRMNKGTKKSYRALSLKIIHYFDHKDKDVVRRDDLLHEVVALNQNYSEEIVDNWIKKLHAEKILRVTKGRYSEVVIA